MFHRRVNLADPDVPHDWIGSEQWRSWEAPLNVVRGESYRQESLMALCGPARPQGYLVPVESKVAREPDNPVDGNALRVEIRGEHVGYLAEELAEQLSPPLDKARCDGFEVAGIIRGGYSDSPSFGLHLWLNRLVTPGPRIKLHPSVIEQFAISWPPMPGEGSDSPEGLRLWAGRFGNQIMTGASSHHGKWKEVDHEDTLSAIKKSRKFLEAEHDPLERHYAFNVLESALYKCRTVLPGALEEFEATCERHHMEMEQMRSALIAYFGGVPVLPLYKQMTIMKTKAKDYQSAKDWCLRGLQAYGSDAIRPEAVEDLKTRLTKLER